jgi:hypothetical protein
MFMRCAILFLRTRPGSSATIAIGNTLQFVSGGYNCRRTRFTMSPTASRKQADAVSADDESAAGKSTKASDRILERAIPTPAPSRRYVTRRLVVLWTRL